MQVANTLAYYDTAIITAVKSFLVPAPWSLHPSLSAWHSNNFCKYFLPLQTVVKFACFVKYSSAVNSIYSGQLALSCIRPYFDVLLSNVRPAQNIP
jgi:hypothetical protein